MMIEELTNFPSLGWIKKLNETRRFSGSIGTGRTGMFTVHTFQYQVWTREEAGKDGEKHKYLCCSCYVQPPASSGKECYGNEETQFDLAPENVEMAKAWLLERVNKYTEIGEA